MRTWWDNEDILRQFRDWLTETEHDVAERLDAEPFTKDDDQFEPGDNQFEPGDARCDQELEPLPDVGLMSLVEAFTALRHELKLQTKSARGMESQLQEAMTGLETARRHLESVRAREGETAMRVARPLVESLAAVDEALHRGAQAVQATHEQIRRRSPERLAEKLDDQFRQLPGWRRWLARGWQRQVRQICTEMLVEADADAFHRLMEGYALIVNRMTRILQEHEVQRIECVGRRVDPARMTVVELTQDAEVEPETVIAEVRPGYEWQGKVIRFAEVRAASGPSS